MSLDSGTENSEQVPPNPVPTRSKRDWVILGLIGVTAILVVVAVALAVVDTTRQAALEKTKSVAIPTVAAVTATPASPLADVTSTQIPTGDPAACSTFSMIPTADPTTSSLFPAVSSDDWVEGSPDAPVTFIVYSDFM